MTAVGGGTVYGKPVYPASFRIWSPAHKSVEFVGNISCKHNRYWWVVYTVGFKERPWVNEAGATLWL